MRIWVNEGARRDSQQPIRTGTVIPPPNVKPLKLRVRKNIVQLTPVEVNEYRMKLDELGIGDPSPDSPWQRLAYIHSNWCLHYHEAFLFWHRANLLHRAFSLPQSAGFPWANLPAFTVPQPDDDYLSGHPETYFDAQYEQPHDNYRVQPVPDPGRNSGQPVLDSRARPAQRPQ